MAEIIEEESAGEVMICTVQNDHDYVQSENEENEAVEFYYPNQLQVDNDVFVEDEAPILQVVEGDGEINDQVRLVLHNVKDGSQIFVEESDQLGNVCLIIKDEQSDEEEETEDMDINEEEFSEDIDEDTDKKEIIKITSKQDRAIKGSRPNVSKLTVNDCWWTIACGPPYICKVCNAEFDSKHSEFTQHVEDHCDPLFQYSVFDRTLSEIEGGYDFGHLCTTCGRCFSKNIDLISHKSTHRKQQIYGCGACQKSFFSPSAYKAHMLKEHLLDIGEEDDDAPVTTLYQRRTEKSFRDKLHKCNLCDEEFEISTMLDMHKKQVHEVTTYQCTLCDHKSFHSYWEFQRHSALHTMNHRIACDICDRSFASKGSLYCHMLLHGEKKHNCAKCGKKFALKTALKNHERQHSEERPFKCSICGKGFKTYTIHRAHFLTHIGVKPYKCETCSRLFAQKQQLIAHSRTHTGEKPFICPYCGVAFALNGNLTVHKRRHTGEMPYVCDFCQKGFYDTSSRKKHMKKCCAQ